MSKPLLWTFEGFVTLANNRVVQDWYWDDIGIDERDDIRDRVAYLGSVERNLWKEPHFKFMGDMGEIRKNAAGGALRVYGYFPMRDHRVFVFLHGTIKKANKDVKGTDTARLRLKRLMNGQGSTHEFDFEEGPTGTGSAKQGDKGSSGLQ